MEPVENQSACTVPPADIEGEVWAETPFYVITVDGGAATFYLLSDWVLLNMARLERLLDEKTLSALDVKTVQFRCGGLEHFDLSGAWLLYRVGERLRALGRIIDFKDFREEHINFIEDVLDIEYARDTSVEYEPFLLRLTEKLFLLFREMGSGLAQRSEWWLQVLHALVTNLARPRRMRWIATVRHVGDAGISAIGIVALMSFLIALVLGFQSQSQLVQFGAQIFTVDLVSISVLREMGGLLTAILVAGRSGSAFAAEIGVMRLNEEVDAMKTMGVDPIDALIVPRVIALMVCLPLLTFIAALAGLLGMFAIVTLMLDIPLTLAVDRFLGLEPMRHFTVGMIKAPVFALVIGLIGTYRGFYVERSAGAVGRNTTAAVVESVFTVIIVDAVFSILFTELGW
jgi:phospholipid/cholesterol/gamma-HCH transport system permease protein